MTVDAERARALAWLATSDGAALLAEAGALPNDRLRRLTVLRRRVPAPIAAAAVELLELRHRARAKFGAAEGMFFTPEGLEQATGDPIAAYRAGRFPPGVPVLDACSGMGGDALHLAAGRPVVAVDRSIAAAMCTRLNLAHAPRPTAYPAHTLCADVTAISLHRLASGGVRSAFFDPSRRGDGPGGERRRLRGAEDYTPPLRWLEALRAAFSNVCVKVSPALDDAALCRAGGRVEFLSDRGECKEAALWFGAVADPLELPYSAAEPYFATVVGADHVSATLAPFACQPLETREIAEFLYEPDPAVIRAHLVPQLACRLDAAALDPAVPYLTAALAVGTPFATAFRIVESLPFSEREVQRRLRSLGARVTAVKKRNVPFEPAAVQKALSPCGDRELELVLTRRSGRAIALLCERIPRAGSG